MNGLRSHGNSANEIKYSNCTSRVAQDAAITAAGVNGKEGMSAHELSLIDKLYEPKANKKLFRVITVIAYCFSVSLIAILLSLYYLFLWDPYIKNNPKMQQQLLLQDSQHTTAMPTTGTTSLLKPAWATKGPRVLALTSPVLETKRMEPLKTVAAVGQKSWVVAQSASSLLQEPKSLSLMEKPKSQGGENKPLEVSTIRSSRLENPFTLYAKGKRDH